MAFAASLGAAVVADVLPTTRAAGPPAGVAQPPDVGFAWEALQAMAAVAVLAFAVRLYFAYRDYLRLPHAAGVVAATQAIVALVLVALYVVGSSVAQ